MRYTAAFNPGSGAEGGDLPAEGTATMMNIEMNKEMQAAAEKGGGSGGGKKKGGAKKVGMAVAAAKKLGKKGGKK